MAELSKKGRGGRAPPPVGAKPLRADKAAELEAKKRGALNPKMWGAWIDEAEQHHRFAVEARTTAFGAAHPRTVEAQEELVRTLLARLHDWDENAAMVPLKHRPSTRNVDDLRSEAETLATRILQARELTQGRNQAATLRSERLLGKVLERGIPPPREDKKSLFDESNLPKAARKVAADDSSASPFSLPPPEPGHNPWQQAGRVNELRASIHDLGRRQLVVPEWRTLVVPPNPTRGSTHPLGYAPAYYDARDEGPVPPWRSYPGRGMDFSDKHGDHIAYKVSHRRAI